MSLFTDSINNDLMQIESDSDSPTFTWNGQTYICIPDEFLSSNLKTVNVGYDSNSTFTIKVRTNQFNGVYPQLGDVIVYGGKRLEISTIQPPSHGQFFVFICDTSQMGYKR